MDNINTKEDIINNVPNIQNNNIENNQINEIKEEKINNKDNINNIDDNLNKENNINLENIINISSNDEEISKIVEENNKQVDNLLSEYQLNIINDIIDLNENEFKNKLSEFINFSSEKINSIKIINDICNKIKEKILLNYNIMIEKQKINMNEYNILKEYEQKLDYVISLQNSVINDLKNINNELKQNINSFKDENNKNNIETSDKELTDNINNANNNIKNLENLLQNHVNKNVLDNLNNINIPNFNENDNFFNVLQNCYNPIKEINKAYEQILMELSLQENK